MRRDTKEALLRLFERARRERLISQAVLDELSAALDDDESRQRTKEDILGQVRSLLEKDTVTGPEEILESLEQNTTRDERAIRRAVRIIREPLERGEFGHVDFGEDEYLFG